MKIHKEGYSIIIPSLIIIASLIFAEYYFIDSRVVSIILAVLLAAALGVIVFFFRVPKRQRIPGDNVITSVADGEVVIIKKVFEDEYFHDERLQVSVYMNLLNVHVNFWPCDGEVTYYKYHPGKFYMAYMPKASTDNEHTSVVVKTKSGQEILFRQIAGYFARRVISYAEVGKECKKASQCGVIKLGSRIDMFLPLDADIKVALEDDVKACNTIIAEL